MFLSPSVVILLCFQLGGLLALPRPAPWDDGKYRPMPGENGPLPGPDGDNGMYREKGRKSTERNTETVTQESLQQRTEQTDGTTERDAAGDNNTGGGDVTEPVTESSPQTSSDRKDEESTEISAEKQEDVKNDGGSNKVICYFEDWAKWRTGKGSFGEDEMLSAPCTHVIYSFATLDGSSNMVQYAFTPTAVQKLKAKGVKVMLALGGAVDSKGDKYSRMASTPENRKVFINSVLEIMKKHDFDGFDVDWEYPTCTSGPDTRGTYPQDKQNFVLLIKELRQALAGKLLTIATHAGKNVVDQAYDLPALHEHLDWINVMTYDLHGSWEKEALHHSPLRAAQGLSIDSAVQLYKGAGVPADKIVIGVPTYGKSLKLADPAKHEYGAAVTGAGDKGPYTGEAGTLGYMEICENVKNSGWKVEGATEDVGPYAYGGDQFVGFDDAQTAARKAEYAKEQGLGGVMVWSLASEDFSDVCGCGKYPVISALHKVLVEGAAAKECRL